MSARIPRSPATRPAVYHSAAEEPSPTKRHAYLVIAHHQFDILEKLLRLLDDERNDVFIHIDAKVADFDFGRFTSMPTRGGLYFVPRVNVNWGGFSQIRCELALLKCATRRPYAYYHLISGVDLPLKTQDEIHDYFDRHDGVEFIHYAADDIETVSNRVARYHLDDWRGVMRSEQLKRLVTVADTGYTFAQRLAGVNRLQRIPLDLRFGAQWFSITHECATFVVAQEDWITEHFARSSRGDELFLQTLVFNSELRSRLVDDLPAGDYLSCLRYVDWRRGDPYIWRAADFDLLIGSDYLFARKFDTRVDAEIIDRIVDHVDAGQRGQR